ncbi:MAG: sulfurtransferase TusA family protein [Nitrospirae bacterium]|nr:sulfurtransferase TusA family protein [Candidatus Manganitrophaceae bacterium]
MKSDQVLDCKGMKCPMPILKTKMALETLRVGQILEMIATDKGSKPDIGAFIEQTGHALLSMNEHNGVYTYYIQKTK